MREKNHIASIQKKIVMKFRLQVRRKSTHLQYNFAFANKFIGFNF